MTMTGEREAVEDDALLGRITGKRLARPKSDRPWSEVAAGVRANEAPVGLAWYLMHTERSARVIQDLIKTNGFELFYPVIRRMVRPPLDRLSKAQRRNAHLFARPVEEPMFPGYPFVRFDRATEEWRELFKLAGVHGIACIGDDPYPLPEAFVEKLIGLQVGGAIPGETPVYELVFEIGESVRVCDGPFAGHNGTIERLDESGRVRLLLALFGRETPSAFWLDQIEKL